MFCIYEVFGPLHLAFCDVSEFYFTNRMVFQNLRGLVLNCIISAMCSSFFFICMNKMKPKQRFSTLKHIFALYVQLKQAGGACGKSIKNNEKMIPHEKEAEKRSRSCMFLGLNE